MDRKKQYKRRWIHQSRALARPLELENYNESTESENESDGNLYYNTSSCSYNNPTNTNQLQSCSRLGNTCEPNNTASSAIGNPTYNDVNVATDSESDTCTNEPHLQNIHASLGEWSWDMIDGLEPESESEDEKEDETLSSDLSEWATENRITHTAIDKLLRILTKHGHTSLPATARSLLQTRKNVETQTISNMEYYYFGFEKEFKKNLLTYSPELINQINSIDISLNIDGLPLFKSSKTALWPVLCSIDLKPKKVFAVVLTLGTSKPTNLDFLNEIIQELNFILHHGININEKLIHINLKRIVCDAPAKAMVKGIKLYSGYYGCDRCSQRGTWVGKMTYQDIDDLQLRTDETFRRQTQPDHHHKRSPFCDLSIDMVKTFPIDYMHQACLGVMKRLLLTWMRGKKKETKISFQNIEEISTKLIILKRFIPKIFARKPRSLTEVDYWKATEYRQFLLYTGKLVLKGILKDELYEHFMTLSVAIAILVSDELVLRYANYAKELLIYFVHQARHLYGEEFLVYNVHGLLHLVDVAKEHGSLSNCDAFCFENHMQHLKKMVRSGKNPLGQIVRRQYEFDEIQSFVKASDGFSNKNPNNAYVLKEQHSCCEIIGEQEEIDNNGQHLVLCRVYSRGEPIFNTPCDSRILGASKFLKRNASMKMLPVQSLNHQAIFIDSTVLHVICLAVLHEF